MFPKLSQKNPKTYDKSIIGKRSNDKFISKSSFFNNCFLKVKANQIPAKTT